jgi:ABC-type branched-subunit amino acid transport system ATPase component
MVDVARALAGKPSLLLLDEPVAGLSAPEVESLRQVILRAREQGIAILLVEHHMRFLMGLCDRVTVIDHGVVLAEGAPAEVQADERVLEAYLGRRRR